MLDTPMTAGYNSVGKSGALYHELRDSLQGVKQFLDGNTQALKPGMGALFAAVPHTRHLLDNLIYLLNGFKANVQQLDSDQMSGVHEMTRFAVQLDDFLETAHDFLPDDSTAVRDVQRTARVLTSLSRLNEVKGELLFLVDGIVGHLYELKG